MDAASSADAVRVANAILLPRMMHPNLLSRHHRVRGPEWEMNELGCDAGYRKSMRA
jgi:hypothetical protein